jgi:predicted negative regulator of RcsB-dependent stress response
MGTAAKILVGLGAAMVCYGVAVVIQNITHGSAGKLMVHPAARYQGFALGTLGASMLAVAATLSSEHPIAWTLSLVVAAGGIGLWYVRRLRQGDTIGNRLQAMVEDGEVGKDEVDELCELVGQRYADDALTAGMALMYVSNRLHEIGRFDLAVAVIETVPADIDDEVRFWRDTDLAFANFESGHYEAARRLLDQGQELGLDAMKTTVAGDVSVRHEVLDSVLCAYEGRPRAALGSLDDVRDSETWGLLIEVARAHAHAALGDRDEGRAVLGHVRDRFGSDALARALRPEGPATSLAQEMSGASAYR